MLPSKFSPGDMAPAVELTDGHGRTHSLPRQGDGAGPTVLVFFRGNW